MDKPIFMGNFIYCFWQDLPVLGNSCHGCEHMIKVADDYFCNYETEEEKAVQEDSYTMSELIMLLVQCMEKGQVTIKREELKKLLQL